MAFAEIEGLRWVLKHSRMAFGSGLASRTRHVEPGDVFVFYVTRGAFHNPTRDRSQFAGLATVTTPVRTLRRPVEIAGRQFALACNLRIDVVLPERKGIPVEPLVSKLSFIKRKQVWGQYIRAGLIELPAHDLALVEQVLKRSGLPRRKTKG